MSENPSSAALFDSLRSVVDTETSRAIEHLIRNGHDRDLNRINVLDFALKSHVATDRAIAAFLHAARLGIFEMQWNVMCPGCGGVLDTNRTLQTVRDSEYHCQLCAAGYEPTLDEMIEVAFTITPRVRKIPAHDPNSLSIVEYNRQIFWSSGIALPEHLEELFERIVIDGVELSPGERASMSFQLPPAFVIIFDPVTHSSQFIDVQGEPTYDRQSLSMVFSPGHVMNEAITLRPGPFRLSVENKTDRRVLPAAYIAGDELHALLGRRKPFLTAKRLLTNQTFRDLYRTDALKLDQKLKITSMTFLFTDLKGSTALYDRVGDIKAFDLVREHFDLLNAIVVGEEGAIVKTIGDAVMATFETADRAIAAALKMRQAIGQIAKTNQQSNDMLLKIGIHEGPCLAVMLNERQDFFGQTVNVAARVQGLADSRAILTTGTVVNRPETAKFLKSVGVVPVVRRQTLPGITQELTLYALP